MTEYEDVEDDYMSMTFPEPSHDKNGRTHPRLARKDYDADVTCCSAPMARSTSNADSQDDDDDYMAMAIPEPGTKKKESSLQRRARKEREAETKGRTKSKAERAAEEAARREEALSTELDSTNKGYQMLAKLGYKPGSALGKTTSETARTQPINVEVKEDRGGIGIATKRRREILEATEHQAKKAKAEEGDYRERMRLEREERRLEGQLVGAQKVAEGLDVEHDEEKSAATQEGVEANKASAKAPRRTAKPLSHVNYLYRRVVRQRREKGRDQRVRKDLHESPNATRYSDGEEEDDDKIALNKQPRDLVVFDDDDLDADDEELEEFEALSVDDRLEKVILYLREKYNYCFWCKSKYPDNSMDGCPGVTEEDHD